MRRAGLLRAAVYLVRPDGYIALANPHADPKQIRDYFSADRYGLLIRHTLELCRP